MNPPDTFEADFRRVFDERFPALFRYLDRLCADPDLAADLAQEAFVRLYERKTMPLEVRTWLVAVSSNLLRDERRRRSRRRRLLLGRAASDLMGDSEPSPDAGPLRAEVRQMVRAALDTLPERDAQLLLLREEGLSYREIALALGLNEVSVGTLLLRARAAFQTAMEARPYAS
ncbi:MAG: sigma-70 family RNA polymerase sigma factor [Gemmatimonadetes bacterium]|nr:sigma-70 family RNA polymerase sigma factor [Gemmatimonadota bacterium]